jgi:hypothetical protein
LLGRIWFALAGEQGDAVNLQEQEEMEHVLIVEQKYKRNVQLLIIHNG